MTTLEKPSLLQLKGTINGIKKDLINSVKIPHSLWVTLHNSCFFMLKRSSQQIFYFILIFYVKFLSREARSKDGIFLIFLICLVGRPLAGRSNSSSSATFPEITIGG